MLLSLERDLQQLCPRPSDISRKSSPDPPSSILKGILIPAIIPSLAVVYQWQELPFGVLESKPAAVPAVTLTLNSAAAASTNVRLLHH